jgi:hypothetical protein
MYAYAKEFSESRANSRKSLTIEPDLKVFIGVVRMKIFPRPEIGRRDLPVPWL